MPERTLTQRQAHAAHALLDSLDPDECAEVGVLDSVIWNRKALEPHATAFDRARQAAIRGHLKTEDGEVQRVEEGDTVHPLEAQLGIYLEDDAPYEEIAGAIEDAATEEVEVTLATAPASTLMEMQGDLDDWHFMVDVSLG